MEFSCKSLIVLGDQLTKCAFHDQNARNSHYFPTNPPGDRFESACILSQPQWSLACRFRCSEECRHSRGLAVKGPVSGEEYRTSRTEGREFRLQSLPDEFSISEFRNGTVQRPVAFPRRPVRSGRPGSRHGPPKGLRHPIPGTGEGFAGPPPRPTGHGLCGAANSSST